MTSLGEDVELGGDLCCLQREEVRGGVFDVDGVVFGLEDEGGRGIGGNGEIGVVGEVLLGNCDVAGVDDDGEVGAAALLVGCVKRFVETLVEVGAEGRGEMAAGREAEDSDALGVYPPL